ncbi:MAG: carbohydrate kinase [Pseudomonadota bacterium]
MILCAGESLIDMIPNADGAYVPHVGGAVLNTAVALGRMGVPTGLVTGLSSDPFGQMIAAHLDGSNVSADHAVRSDRNTTLAFVHLTDGHATYTFYDNDTATSAILPGDLPALPDGVEAVFFGGISLCNPPVADSLLDMALGVPEDTLLMADPNIRPGFAADQEAYRSRLEKLITRADIVKLSDDDIHWLLPGVSPLDHKAEQVLEMGAGMLLLTAGAEGATAYRAGQDPVHGAASRAQVVDTVGAGDTFNAGCLAALRRTDALDPRNVASLDKDTIMDMLSLAARAAAITVSRAGANPPWAHELEG